VTLPASFLLAAVILAALSLIYTNLPLNNAYAQYFGGGDEPLTQDQIKFCQDNGVDPCTQNNILAKEKVLHAQTTTYGGVPQNNQPSQSELYTCRQLGIADSDCTTQNIQTTLALRNNPQLQSQQQTNPITNSKCIIATAAFGSELAPPVQFLREFRDQHILMTTSGSSFMNVFNTWYYSFSPQVADYERGQPWMQQMVRTLIQPLLGILTLSEKAFTVIPGEYGSLAAGLVASSMIGAVYFTPVAMSIKQVRKQKFNPKLAAIIVAGLAVSVVAALLANNSTALMITTSFLVLGTLSIAAILSANVVAFGFRRIIKGSDRRK